MKLRTVQLRFARKASTFMKYCLAKVCHVGPLNRWHLQSAFLVAFRDACASVVYPYFTIIYVPVHCLYDEKCCDAKAFSDIHVIVLQGKDQKRPSSILMSLGYVVVWVKIRGIYFFLFIIIVINNLYITIFIL